ncbi:Nsg2 protein [Candida orthopsilosis Co 90-125]|uniref:Nsg2 protein n=1 Tax=Candida orthopsilosis (strain 90-125) TaxID=1136231 RepID=H8X1E1_CANO9|nr:Nsg2 protein [Candida orthopsilosis Co 90-125]CCG22181.1 Nsg2 protein [Candida orthopsilosis Co 90-125]
MSDLRRIALSNTNIKGMEASQLPPQQGNTTPVPGQMGKTDSEINLTRPELYGMYEGDSFVDFNKDIDDSSLLDLNVLSAEKVKANGKKAAVKTEVAPKLTLYSLPLPLKLVIVASSAYIYNQVIRHINYNHFSENQLVNYPLTITHVFLYAFVSKFKLSNYIEINDDLLNAGDEILALTLQGLLMASLHPILDKILPKFFSKRLLSSNPNPSSKSNVSSDLIRSCITFLGISYAIRKIEWSSFLQVSIIWSLINPGLWLLLDGTISGFLASLIASTIACVSIYSQNHNFINGYSKTTDDVIALWLWIGSFFFCGIIIFGKLGRGLFGNN